MEVSELVAPCAPVKPGWVQAACFARALSLHVGAVHYQYEVRAGSGVLEVRLHHLGDAEAIAALNTLTDRASMEPFYASYQGLPVPVSLSATPDGFATFSFNPLAIPPSPPPSAAALAATIAGSTAGGGLLILVAIGAFLLVLHRTRKRKESEPVGFRWQAEDASNFKANTKQPTPPGAAGAAPASAGERRHRLPRFALRFGHPRGRKSASVQPYAAGQPAIADASVPATDDVLLAKQERDRESTNGAGRSAKSPHADARAARKYLRGGVESQETKAAST